ncbi:MAG: hypothetical protein ABSF03_21445 [Streptosporangiaceae bacterium]|jgi:DNA-binding NarL/FixJ family response regulator
MTGPLQPVTSALVQAAALRDAFPGYAVNVIVRYDDPPRIEAVSRDGSNPYCLISTDANEIWRELRQSADDRTRRLPASGAEGGRCEQDRGL